MRGKIVRIVSEEELISRIAQKDKLALEYLYDRYSSALYGVILRIVKDEELASEILNDAFLRFWEKASTYDKSRGRLYTWMVNISRHLAIDKTRSREYLKTRKTDSVDSFVYTDAGPRADDLAVEGIGLRELLNKLKPDQRELIEWMYFEGYTQSEIEKNFGIPLGTVKTRVRAGLAALRKIVGVDS